ncbi:hypothetical protein RND71_023421 [Anisodus tanguticus]|uniref:Uncharacterized protein n=1 Tax=Anisodus tanguticus TaxID=243964 RepID=A0AAE1RTV4_9SOLA|nr:hypothetical protein RND71_023421 [Anisodus tanguticus]
MKQDLQSSLWYQTALLKSELSQICLTDSQDIDKIEFVTQHHSSNILAAGLSNSIRDTTQHACLCNNKSQASISNFECKKEECRTKTELTESLRKAHINQLAKLQEVKLEIGRQENELFVKSEEIFEVKKLYDEIKSSIHEKESCLRNLSSAHEKLQLDYGEKIGRLEVQNKDLVLVLDETTSKIQDLEMQVFASNK